MKTMQKPIHCGQEWLNMQPTNGGRICGQCDKKIMDFSKNSWNEIEQYQLQNNNSVCGMYNPKQLLHWGKEVPKKSDNLFKAAATTGLAFSLSFSSSAQSPIPMDSLVIKGQIIDEEDGTPLQFPSVILKGSKIGTMADINGNFELIIKKVSDSSIPDTLELHSLGYQNKLIYINEQNNGIETSPNEITLNLSMKKGAAIVFYVTKPSLAQQIKWTLRKWFFRTDR